MVRNHCDYSLHLISDGVRRYIRILRTLNSDLQAYGVIKVE
jgi:hypothetical protein